MSSPYTFVKSSLPGWLYDALQSGQFGSTESGELTAQQAWTLTGWFRRCVDLRGQAMADMPFIVKRFGTDTVIWDSDEDRPPELDWLRGLPSYLYKCEAALTLHGGAYALKRVERGRDIGLQWFNPLSIEPNYSTTGIDFYWRTVGGKRVPILAEDMLATFSSDPYVEMGPGNPLARAAHLPAGVLYELNRFASSFLSRGMIKASLVTVPPSTSKEARDELEHWWQGWFRGTRTDTKVVSADVVPVVVGEGLGTLADTELLSQMRQDVGATFGVPESMLTSSAANYATAMADQLGFYQWTVLPQARTIGDALNESYLNERGLALVWEEQRIEALQRAEVDKAQAINALTQQPVLTLNEARELMGYEPITGGEDIVEAPSEEVQREVRQWRKKAERLGRDVSFEPNVLEPHHYAVIKSRLNSEMDLGQCFEYPYR